MIAQGKGQSKFYFVLANISLNNTKVAQKGLIQVESDTVFPIVLKVLKTTMKLSPKG